MANIITDSSFEADVIKSDVPVLVDFFAEWCGPCRAMSPVIDELATEYEGKVKVVKLNIDENPESAGKYGVMSIPTFILFKGGESAEQIVGGRSKEEMQELLNKHV